MGYLLHFPDVYKKISQIVVDASGNLNAVRAFEAMGAMGGGWGPGRASMSPADNDRKIQAT